MQVGEPRHKILVVDDDPLTARLVAHWLADSGYTTALAANGDEAMNWLVEEEFDAVISQVQMPVMNGFELLQHIHLRFPSLPVVLMTALVEPDMRAAALAWGATTLLQKPLTREELLAALSGPRELSAIA